MFNEYIRTIYGWKAGEEFAQRDSHNEVLKDLGFDNVRLYRGPFCLFVCNLVLIRYFNLAIHIYIDIHIQLI